MTQRLGKDETGCLIDGHAGWRGPLRVIKMARDLGMPLSDQDILMVHRVNTDTMTEDDVWLELADEAETWLNENVASDGCSFGWHDGEFFYQSTEWWDVL